MATLFNWFDAAKLFFTNLAQWFALNPGELAAGRFPWDPDPGEPGNGDPDDTFTLEEALAAEDLPDRYTISDASLALEPGTIEAVEEQITAAQAILDGAE